MTEAPRSPHLKTTARARRQIRVRGTVQGVGFRPYVHRQATRLGLAGWIANTAEGVTIEVEGAPERLDDLLDGLRQSPPPRAVVSEIDVSEAELRGDATFAIRASVTGGRRSAHISPDLTTCDACLAELSDPSDRRYRYPFINCTDCGPRFSIIKDLPYDRARTSMQRFGMCEACRAEYEDPPSRRFHAEPTACPNCGPRVALWNPAGGVIARDDAALGLAATAIRRGEIVAAKGVGGFHLLVDARNEAAVRRLRRRKRRPENPFAIMFPALEQVSQACLLSLEEEAPACTGLSPLAWATATWRCATSSRPLRSISPTPMRP